MTTIATPVFTFFATLVAMVLMLFLTLGVSYLQERWHKRRTQKHAH